MELCGYIYLYGVTNGGQASKYGGECTGKSKHDIRKPSSQVRQNKDRQK
jgi:hypothetical protein